MNKKLTLKDLGAEKCINLLKPIQCDCGCGGYVYAILETKQDVVDMAGGLLEEEECKHAYIFMITDCDVRGAFTDENGVHAFVMSAQDGSDLVMSFEEQVNLVKDIIEKIEPHCVGIMQYTKDNLYRVVTETIYDKKIKGGLNGKIKR